MLNYFKKTLTSKEIRMQIGKRLHDERIKANLSLDKLAELTGFSKPTVQRWEKGWKNGTGENVIPTLDQLIELCAIYKCSPGYLLCEYDEKTRQAFDASLELGMTEDSIKRFQEDAILQLNSLNPEPGTSNMCFYNFLLANFDNLEDILRDRHNYENWESLADKQPGIEIARKALQTPAIQKEVFYIHDFRDTSDRTMFRIERLKELLKQYYDTNNRTNLSTEYLVERTIAYCGYVPPNAIRQNDFSLSEAFLDIVRRFFKNYQDEMKKYDQFVISQKLKKAKIDPNFKGHLLESKS